MQQALQQYDQTKNMHALLMGTYLEDHDSHDSAQTDEHEQRVVEQEQKAVEQQQKVAMMISKITIVKTLRHEIEAVAGDICKEKTGIALLISTIFCFCS